MSFPPGTKVDTLLPRFRNVLGDAGADGLKSFFGFFCSLSFSLEREEIRDLGFANSRPDNFPIDSKILTLSSILFDSALTEIF